VYMNRSRNYSHGNHDMGVLYETLRADVIVV
jgi:hypothetical protein